MVAKELDDKKKALEQEVDAVEASVRHDLAGQVTDQECVLNARIEEYNENVKAMEKQTSDVGLGCRISCNVLMRMKLSSITESLKTLNSQTHRSKLSQRPTSISTSN